MKSVRATTGRTVYTAAVLLLAFTVYGCHQANDQNDPAPEDGLTLHVTDPVERDYVEIKDSGVLRMITQYSSNSYFLHQGVEVGFEYELLKSFARENDLALEVVIIGENENPYDLLNSGEGDVIAANYTITPERRQIVNFTRPYNLVDQHVVYSANLDNRPVTIEQLAESGIQITVRRNSSYYVQLQELKEQGYDLNIRVIADDMDTESLLQQVAAGNIQATVSDNNMFQAAGQYMQGLNDGPEIAKNDTIAWAIRKNAPDLETQMNKFLYKHFRFTDDRVEPKRSAFMNILRHRYFEEGPRLAGYYNPDFQYSNIGLISPYDDLIREVADSLELDWLMLAAMIAQESRFNPSAKSWAGAVGLMQILPRFSEVEYQHLYTPEVNIREGAKIIREHLDHYAYLDTLDQWSFALATYNVGVGHMSDARRIAIDLNKDPNKWEHVEDALLKLMQRRFYQNARHGFARGIETVQYVKEVMNRYQMYQRVVTLAEQRASVSTGIYGYGNRTFNLP